LPISLTYGCCPGAANVTVGKGMTQTDIHGRNLSVANDYQSHLLPFLSIT